MKKSRINPISDKRKALLERELPIKCEIIRRAKNKCGQCGKEASMLYPLAVHHKKIGADREEIKSVEDGIALCIKCHLGGRHGLKIILDSQPQFGGKK